MDFQTILNAVQPELVTIVIAAATAGVAYLYQWGIQRLPTNAQKIINGLAQTATHAVEQKYIDINPGSSLKKQEALTIVAAMCKELGLPLNENNVNAAIESAVYTMNQYQKFRAPASGMRKDTREVPTVATPAPTTPGTSAAK